MSFVFYTEGSFQNSQGCHFFMSRRMWNLAITVMDLFKKSQVYINGQNLPKAGPNGSEPDFKQQYLAPIRTLKEDDQCNLLQLVIDKKLSILGMKTAAVETKLMETLKSTFLNLVHIKTWEEAEERLPFYTNKEVLLQFSKLNFTSGTPHSFANFCKRAKDSLNPTPGEESSNEDMIISDSTTQCRACIITSSFTDLYSSRISAIDPDFTGTSLVAISIYKVCFGLYRCMQLL